MNADRSKLFCSLDFKELIELLVRKVTSTEAPVDDQDSHRPPERQREKRCMCGPCLDVISRAHSESSRQSREHGDAFVQHWLSDTHHEDHAEPTVPREVLLDGYASSYLERLDQDWWKGKERMDN